MLLLSQVLDLMTVKDNGALIHGTPSQIYMMRQTGDGRSTATQSTNMEPAGRQDDTLKLRAALNEKEMELIELRETHMQLVVRHRLISPVGCVLTATCAYLN